MGIKKHMEKEVIFSMKKVILILILSIFTSFVLAGVSLADEMQVKSVDTILAEIRMEQGIVSSDKIEVNKVSQAKLEELGDSVMEAMIGNTAMHEQMDLRLGGDGSESLKAFHINIAFNYLSDYPNGMMNIMSGGMLSNNNSTNDSGWNWDNMMGNDNSTIGSGLNRIGAMTAFAFSAVATGFVLLLLIIIIAVVIFAMRKSKKITHAHEKSIEILATRYANGEITKEEFDTMTKNIQSLK